MLTIQAQIPSCKDVTLLTVEFILRITGYGLQTTDAEILPHLSQVPPGTTLYSDTSVDPAGLVGGDDVLLKTVE